MYWDNDVTPSLSVSLIRSLSLCCIWDGVASCQVPAFLWSGGANWLPSLSCPPVIAGIFQISVKTSQIKSESETAWDSLDCSRNWWQRRAVPTWQLYSDQSWSNDIFTINRQLSIHFTSYSTVQCFSLSVNESSVYPSSLRSFNCCSKNKHGRVSTQRRPGPTKTRSLDTGGSPPMMSALPHNHPVFTILWKWNV